MQTAYISYISYYPDLAIPGAQDAIVASTDLAVQAGVERLVLLSGRGEEEAQACEKVVATSGVEWTVGAVRLVQPELQRELPAGPGARR